jgi:fatty acid desaturase
VTPAQRRAAARRAALPALGLVAGIVLVAVGQGVVGSLLVGIGLTVLIALVFYEIGLSEDRERERENRRRPS